jgi:DNA-binding NtrC family response regulator
MRLRQPIPINMKNEFPFCTFIVDDDKFCRELYQYNLKALGLKEVYQFDNGQDCLNSLVLEPDLVLLDHYMKPLSGLEVLRAIKAYNPEIFVVIISGQEEMQLPILAMEYGAFDYVVKSDVTEERLEKIVEKIQAIKQTPH